ncbi:prevent-host-death family protein [Larkinella sp. VNQ87]|uniref:prevent-host-death family protein n=1 Tax=Larkinella sp. VNQ87 TaxID=3400921 RepID=UPI003C0C8BDD
MTLKAQIIEENGEPKFAVLPYATYQTLAAELEDFDSLEDFLDYVHLIKTKSETKKWHSRDEVWKELGLEE